ncbi:MAG TPA: glycosyltransferase family 9 protein, partial [Roseimicrobium sp.]|nr:glycosyltransferase family 9 protein [Roseimicrobium sp.]
MKRGKILVIRGGAIGDFVLTLPVFAALRTQFPQAIIEVLGYSHIAELARLGGWVNDVRSIESRAMAAFFAEGGDLDPKLSEYLSEFAIIISYLYDPDGIFRTNVSLVSSAQFIEGPHRPDEKQEIHATDVFLKPLERLAIFDADPVPRLPMPDKSVRVAKTPHLVFHPGSGSDRKNWPEEHWVWLIHRVIGETSARLTIVGGEAEGSRMQRLSGGLPTDRVMVLFQKPLPEVAVWLAG